MLKVAVPTREGMVDEHFGHCESFTIYNLTEQRQVSGRESFTPPPACGCKSGVAATLKDMGVSVLLAGNMGDGAVHKLAEQGIEVVRGAAGDVDATLEAWLRGSLKDNQEICLAHAHGHECSH